jgi:hypothetical protein
LPINFAYEVSLSFLLGSLTCCKILRLGSDGFTFPSKEVVLRIFIAIKNQRPSAGFEPANLKPNGKHANNNTTAGGNYSPKYKVKQRIRHTSHLLFMLT